MRYFYLLVAMIAMALMSSRLLGLTQELGFNYYWITVIVGVLLFCLLSLFRFIKGYRFTRPLMLVGTLVFVPIGNPIVITAVFTPQEFQQLPYGHELVLIFMSLSMVSLAFSGERIQHTATRENSKGRDDTPKI